MSAPIVMMIVAESSSGQHPRSLANLVTWQPGQTGNPGGRPRKKPITDRYHRIVETELPDDIRRDLGLPRGATFGDAIALAQARQAIRGETAAAKEMREAIEGRRATPPDSEGKNAAMTIIFDMPMPIPPGTDDETQKTLARHVVAPAQSPR